MSWWNNLKYNTNDWKVKKPNCTRKSKDETYNYVNCKTIQHVLAFIIKEVKRFTSLVFLSVSKALTNKFECSKIIYVSIHIPFIDII